MRVFLLILFILFSLRVKSQVKPENIYGTWVKAKITYKDGRELAQEDLLKYSALKFTFKYPDEFHFSSVYYIQGKTAIFLINDEFLTIRSPEGGVINTLQIERLRDTLVLVQPGMDGFQDPNSLKYYFVPEKVYQNSLAIRVSDIHSIISGDTIFNQCPKIYPTYKGDIFQSYLYKRIANSNSDYMKGRNAHLVAGFIISKNGIADSLKILESVDNDFDKKIVNAFNKAKKDWIPAVYNKRNVSVYVIVELQYSGMNGVMKEMEYGQKAKGAYDAKAYDLALYYFDKALEARPQDKDDLYRRGFCKMFLGNLSGACEDWNKLKSMGGLNADEVLNKYCK